MACTNLPGSWSCDCADGFVRDPWGACVAPCGPPDAPLNTFRSREEFHSALGTVQTEDFDGSGFVNNQQVSSLFAGTITIAPSARLFAGAWTLNRCGDGAPAGVFAGRALLPSVGQPLNLRFPTPIRGIGANVFDDFSCTGTATLTLTVTTVSGRTITVAEDSPLYGDTGFLGVTTDEGIVAARFGGNSANNYLEVDVLAFAHCQ